MNWGLIIQSISLKFSEPGNEIWEDVKLNAKNYQKIANESWFEYKLVFNGKRFGKLCGKNNIWFCEWWKMGLNFVRGTSRVKIPYYPTGTLVTLLSSAFHYFHNDSFLTSFFEHHQLFHYFSIFTTIDYFTTPLFEPPVFFNIFLTWQLLSKCWVVKSKKKKSALNLFTPGVKLKEIMKPCKK